jgi:prevent-host-death family protein
MQKVAVGEARLVTMRELSQRTAQVIAEVNETDSPALVTRHGRFQALIWPLANKNVESLVLTHLSEIVSGLEGFDKNQSEAAVVSTEEAAKMLERSAKEAPKHSR